MQQGRRSWHRLWPCSKPSMILLRHGAMREKQQVDLRELTQQQVCSSSLYLPKSNFTRSNLYAGLDQSTKPFSLPSASLTLGVSDFRLTSSKDLRFSLKFFLNAKSTSAEWVENTRCPRWATPSKKRFWIRAEFQ